MNNDKFHCPKCKLLFDSVNHLPRILNICNHTICSYCINEQLHNTPKQICCPIDKTLYNNISSINIFKENINLIEELQESLNIPSNHNYEISNEDIFFDKSGIMNSDKFNDTMNSLNLNSSIISSSHCYYKKSKDIRINMGENNSQMCNIHTLPLNVICIDERKKICSQCALNNDHVNHQIITENEFMNNIDNLIDLFQDVDNNQIKYLNFNSINTKSTLDKIGNNIDNLIQMINTTKNEIINNIKEQCEHIENYLNERKKEIFDKYQSTSFDISTLRESTLNWMQTVTNKLDQLNEIKEPSSDCIKLLDNEPNKNIFNLIRNGKQLNGRYNFIQEMLKIIDKLESFDKKGILIKPNKNIIDRIFYKEEENDDNNKNNNKENKLEEEKEEDDIEINLNIDELGKKNDMKNNLNKNEEKKEEKKIKTTLFEIEENKELINSLHLTQFKFHFYDNKINNGKEEIKKEEKKETNKNEDNKDIDKENNNIIKDENKEENNIKNIINKYNEKEDNDIENDEDIILNLNINEIQNENKKKNENNKKEKENDVNNINGTNEKNNISKIIDDLSFNDDTLLINPLSINQNDTIYHKKIKNDYPLDLKNKKKENSILEKTNQKINEQPQNPIQENPKTIKTKKIDISELNKNNKIIEQKINIKTNTHKINNKNIKNSFSINSDARSLGNDTENICNNIHNKNEVVINFSKRLSGSKKNQPICANYTKTEKKNVFMKYNGDGAPILMSRSPGRMTCKSKLAGFYSFVPLEKNKNKAEFNHIKNNDKTLISEQELNNKNNDKYKSKNNKNNNNEDENDINTEYSSNTNIRRTSFCINKNIKKMKTLSKDIFSINNKIVKKINSTKVVNSNEEQNDIKKDEEKYNITNFNSSNQINNKLFNSNILLNSTSNLIINNSSNSFENKSKKELQEFINNQLKNNKPNFSRINMNGYGTQYLCSYLHKNPNINYKEIKLLGCNLNDDDLFILTRTILDHDIGLLVLNLSSNKITDESASNILDILKDCKSLKGLSLYNNMISNILKEKLKEYAKLGRKNFEMVQLYI